MNPPSTIRSILITAAVLIGIALLTLAMFAWMGYPLSEFARVLVGDGRDALTFRYFLYQSYDNLAHHPLELGYSLIFYAPGDLTTLAYTIAPYGIALTALPFYLLTGANVILTTNLYIVLTFVLTAWAGWLLARDLFKAPLLVAWLVGLFIAFAPVRIVHLQLAHPEILSTQWLLFNIYFLHRLIDAPRWRWAAGLAITFWLNFISSAYLGYFFLTYAALLIVYLLLTGRDLLTRRLLITALAAAVTAAVLLIPFYGFRFQNGNILEGHPFSEIQFLSARPLNWTQGTSFIYNNINGYEVEEKSIFLGFVPLILALAAWRQRRDHPLVPFFFVVIGVAYVLTLGPTISLGGDPIPAPFALLMQFPGASSIRQPPRFIMLALIGAALLMAFVLTRVFAQLKWGGALVVFGIAALLLTVETIPYNGLLGTRTDGSFRLSAHPTPAFALGGAAPFVPADLNTWLASQPPETAVFNYPVNDDANRQYTYSLPDNYQPMFNGQASFYPVWYRDRDWNAFPSLYTLYALHAHDVQYAMIYTPFLNGDQVNNVHDRIARFPDQLQYVNTFDSVEVYRVIAPPPVDAPVLRFDFDEFVPGDGWYAPERTGDGVTFAWMQTPEATVVLPPLTADQPRIFRAQLFSAADPSLLTSLRLFVNGQPVNLRAQQSGGMTTLLGNISQAAFAGDRLELRLVTLPFASPVERRTGSDWRNLGIAFDWIEISINA